MICHNSAGGLTGDLCRVTKQPVMSRILIPVDFSLPSHNAYRYGLHLAEEFGMDVVLVHYYEGLFNPGEPFVLKDGISIHDSYLQQLRDFAVSTADGIDYPLLEPPGGVEVTYETAVALAPSADIINRTKVGDIDLVVMATRSSKKTLEKWLGSTSITVSEACPCPVFLIPPDVRFSPFRRLVVANNHPTADPLPLWQVKGIADLYRAEVHFVHVEKANESGFFRFVPWALMEELVGQAGEAQYPFKVVSVVKNDVTEGILTYAEEIDADLVVVVNRLRSRWQALFRTTLTQDLALNGEDRPLLVLHTRYAGIEDRLMNSYAEQ